MTIFMASYVSNVFLLSQRLVLISQFQKLTSQFTSLPCLLPILNFHTRLAYQMDDVLVWIVLNSRNTLN